MSPVVLAVEGIAVLLGLISLIVPLARRVKIPFTLLLSLLGVLLGLLTFLHTRFTGFFGDFVGSVHELGLLDDAYLYIFLPPLLFAAGLTVNLRSIVEEFWHVISLAIVAVIVCALMVGYALNLVTDIGIVGCLLFGTIVSTTDTAGVIAIFRDVGAPKRLSTIIEGESLFNDAAAIALFGLFLGMLVKHDQFNLFEGLRDFMLALVGGAVFGYLAGRLCCWLFSFLKDSVTTEVTLTVSVAYLTYVIGSEYLHVSGVVATVTAAIVVGLAGRTRVSPGAWQVLHGVWSHLDFWATSMIFVTGAMYVPRALGSFGLPELRDVAVVFVAALAARGLVVFVLMHPLSVFGLSKSLSPAYKIIVWWGGVRGAVTMALALIVAASDGISPATSHVVLSTATGYVIATLFLNGLSLPLLMKALPLKKFASRDYLLRNRVLDMARERVRVELEEISTLIGGEGGEVDDVLFPHSAERRQRIGANARLRLAVQVWAQREVDLAFMMRERGIISGRHADKARGQSDRLQHALRRGEIEAYRKSLVHDLVLPLGMRVAIWVHRRFGRSGPLAAATSDRFEYLITQRLELRELVHQAEVEAPALFGAKTAAELVELLSLRARMINAEIDALERLYPAFTRAMVHRHLVRLGLGLIQVEYWRHLSQSTITPDLFEDLDSDLRRVGARFHRRPRLKLGSEATALLRATLPISKLHREELKALAACIAPRLAFPDENIPLSEESQPIFYLVTAGQVRADGDTQDLGTGDWFGAVVPLAGGSRVGKATAMGYVNLLRFRADRLAEVLRLYPTLQERLERGARRRRATHAAASLLAQPETPPAPPSRRQA